MDATEDQVRRKAAEDAQLLEHFSDCVGYLRVRLSLVPAEEGGLNSPIYSGYRASWHSGDSEGVAVHHDAPLVVGEGELLELPTEPEVRLFPLSPEHWETVQAVDELWMREGTRVVGRASVLSSHLHSPASEDRRERR